MGVELREQRGPPPSALPRPATSSEWTVPPPRRRARWWVVLAVAAGVMLVGTYLVGVADILDDAGPAIRGEYVADLDTGFGDVPQTDFGSFVTWEERDGFHLLVRDPGRVGMVGVEATRVRLAVAVEVVAEGLEVPSGAALGPFCLDSEDHGYGFVLDEDGSVELLELMASSAPLSNANVRLRSQGTVEPTTPPHRLTLVCGIPAASTGPVHLDGYVDGVQALAVSLPARIEGFRYSMFLGRTRDVAPAEWRVTALRRLNP